MKLLRRKHRNILVLGVALVLLFGFLWSYTDTSITPPLTQVSKNSKEADFFIHNTSSKNFNQQGELTSSLSTPKLEHYPFNNATQLQSPEIKLYQNNQQTWQINANSGIVRNNVEVIELNNQVIIHSGNNPSNSDYILTTEALTITPEKKLLENSKAFTLMTPEGKTTAIGLKANLNTEYLLLKKRVQGHYHAVP